MCERERPVPREELAEILWSGQTPPQWDTALKALASKLRRLAAPWSSGEDGPPRIEGEYGCYRLELPRGSWVDLEAARNALDAAEGSLRAGKPRSGWAPASVAITIARRGFLPGEEGPWIEAMRTKLEGIFLRALDAYTEICLNTAQPELAARMAEEAIAREPYRESSYQRLMLALTAQGNRAEALRVFHRCRELLRDELGVAPSSETEAVYLRLLRES